MRLLVSILVAALVGGVALIGCGSDHKTSSPDTACVAEKNGAVTVVAKNLQFQPRCLTAPSGKPLTITFKNEDGGTQHDLVLQGAGATARTKLTTGPDTQSFTVTGLKPGTYTYICTIHSNMTGELRVTAASETSTTLPGG